MSTCSLNVLFKEYENKKKREYFVYEIKTFEKQGDDIVNSIVMLLGEISIPSWISHDVAALSRYSTGQINLLYSCIVFELFNMLTALLK